MVSLLCVVRFGLASPRPVAAFSSTADLLAQCDDWLALTRMSDPDTGEVCVFTSDAATWDAFETACNDAQDQYTENSCGALKAFSTLDATGKRALCSTWQSTKDTDPKVEKKFNAMDCGTLLLVAKGASDATTLVKCTSYLPASFFKSISPGTVQSAWKFDPACQNSSKTDFKVTSSALSCDHVEASDCATAGTAAGVMSVAGLLGAGTNAPPPLPAYSAGSSWTLQNKLGTTDIPTIIGRLIATFLGLVGSIALLVFVYAGIRYMSAAGGEEGIKAAKDTMKYAMIGLAIIIFAYAIAQFYFQVLTKTT